MQQGDVVQERYELERVIGEGGMATVWRANDRRLGRKVALKALAPWLAGDPEYMVRFFSEAQSVARISNPHVIGILDFGEHDGHPYLVMDHVDGGSAADLVGEPLLPERAAEVVAEAASAAGAAHARGIVHRDVKPGNILLTGEGRVRLADFGISTSAGAEKMTATGQAIGSPHYISPEQVAGQSATPASDVYSLGVVLYELITGHKPFDGDSVTKVAIAHVDQMPDPPSTHVPDLDPYLERLVMRCLAKDPEERFSDGTELAAALSALNDGTSFFDEEEEVVVPVWRRPAVLGAAAFVLMILLAAGMFAFGGLTHQPSVAEAEERSQPGDREGRDRPKPSPSASVATYATPSASPSPTRNESSKDDRSAGDATEPVEDDTSPTDDTQDETDVEPSPEPSPSPEPTTSPAGDAAADGTDAGTSTAEVAAPSAG